MLKLEEQLKNPVWFSLKKSHKKFLIENNDVKFYNPEICTFGSFIDNSKTLEGLNEYVKITDSFFLVSENEIPKIDTTRVFFRKKN